MKMSGSLPSSAASEDSVMSLGPEECYGNYNTINVVVRVRPLTSHEEGRKDIQAVQFPAEGQILVDDHTAAQARIFTYNVVFEPEATQEDVFEHCGIKRLIDMALDGFACTVLAYGQTGAGKTHTLTGTQGESYLPPSGEKQVPGIVHLAFAYLFSQVRQRIGLEYVVQASYLEVYKEQVLDLLNPSTKPLSVRWAKEKGFYAENLFVVECEDAGDLEGVLEEGRKNRQVRSHNMNEHSSRSHTILILLLTSEVRDPEDPTNFVRRYGKLFLVDLAGSEKTKKTNSRGETLKEANNINKSLLVLGNCISALADPKKRNGHIPYRDSTLTKLLADSLGGSGLALMIACVSPSRANTSETLNTLRYASRAKRIRTKPMVRMDPREQLIISLKREVRLLRMENTYLRRNQQNLSNGFRIKNHASGGTISLEDMKEEDIKAMLQQYMQENEILRTENAQLHEMRELLTRDHELVCRENERLLRFAREADRSNRSPTLLTQRRESPSFRSHMGSSDSLLDSTTAWSQHQESWRSLMDLNHEVENGDLGDFKIRSPPGSKRPVHVNHSINSTRKKVGKSLSDISEKKIEPAKQESLQRRNSWGSGIPRPVDKRGSPQSPPTDSHVVNEMVHSPPTPPQKLPPLMSALVPKFGRRNSNKLIEKVTGKTKNPIEEDTDIVPRDLEQVQKAIRGES